MTRVAACLALSCTGCGIIFPLDCFDGKCDAGADTLAMDAPEASVDGDPCANGPDPCRFVEAGTGGCYCGTTMQRKFDYDAAIRGCIYWCDDSVKPTFSHLSKVCPNGCKIEEAGVEDHCFGEPIPSKAADCAK